MTHNLILLPTFAHLCLRSLSNMPARIVSTANGVAGHDTSYKEGVVLVVGKSLEDPRETFWYLMWREGNGAEGRVCLTWDAEGRPFPHENLGIGLDRLTVETNPKLIPLGLLDSEQLQMLKTIIQDTPVPNLPENVHWTRAWKRREWYLQVLRKGEGMGLFTNDDVHKCYMEALAENWQGKDDSCTRSDVFEPCTEGVHAGISL